MARRLSSASHKTEIESIRPLSKLTRDESCRTSKCTAMQQQYSHHNTSCVKAREGLPTKKGKREKAAKREVHVFFKRCSQEEKQYRYYSTVTITVTVRTTFLLEEKKFSSLG